MNSKNALIIFQKNIEIGKVKTRLAASIGEENALKIFKYLVNYTINIANETDAVKILFYSDYIDNEVELPKNFVKMLQTGDDLGQRMSNAFKAVFEAGFEKVVIIGTDCYELKATILKTAFEKLDDNDFALGPANDGGYYFLGMKNLAEKVFQNKRWSTDEVASETLKDIQQLGLSCYQSEMLNDIDVEQDLGILTSLLSVVYM